MINHPLEAERTYLASLLEAIQRCVYFLEASRRKQTWPLPPGDLEARRKDVALYESLAAMNERFAKLQDTLGAGMRHAALLAGESGETFLKTLTFFEKIGVLESVTDWQLCRATRNLAAHEYETDYAAITEHFNTLNGLAPGLYANAARFLDYCREALHILPLRPDFTSEFTAIGRQAITLQLSHSPDAAPNDALTSPNP
jgi:hypothetical protein